MANGVIQEITGWGINQPISISNWVYNIYIILHCIGKIGGELQHRSDSWKLIAGSYLRYSNLLQGKHLH